MKRLIPQKEGKTSKSIPTNQRFTLSYPSFSVFSCRIFLPKTPNRSQLPNTKDLCRSAERCSNHDATCIRYQVILSARVDPFLRNDPFLTSLVPASGRLFFLKLESSFQMKSRLQMFPKKSECGKKFEPPIFLNVPC